MDRLEDVRNLEEVIASSVLDDIPVNLIYEHSIQPCTTSTQEKTRIKSKLYLPENVFDGLKYSHNNRNVCYGRKNSNEKIERSTCPTPLEMIGMVYIIIHTHTRILSIGDMARR